MCRHWPTCSPLTPCTPPSCPGHCLIFLITVSAQIPSSFSFYSPLTGLALATSLLSPLSHSPRLMSSSYIILSFLRPFPLPRKSVFLATCSCLLSLVFVSASTACSASLCPHHLFFSPFAPNTISHHPFYLSHSL